MTKIYIYPLDVYSKDLKEYEDH